MESPLGTEMRPTVTLSGRKSDLARRFPSREYGRDGDSVIISKVGICTSGVTLVRIANGLGEA